MLDNISTKMQNHHLENLTRKRIVVEKRSEGFAWVNNKRYIDFSSNDYLGIRCDEKIKKMLVASAKFYGLGSGSASHVSGYHKPHQELEESFAKFLGREKALYFSSGYLANVGVMTSLIGRKDSVLMDKCCHGSIIDGVRLTRAKYLRYKHNNLNDMSRFLQPRNLNKQFVLTESVFGMEGDISPLNEIVQKISKRATLIVDDAHGIGVLGEHGSGVCEKFNLSTTEIPVLIAPLGKAFGSCGAIVSGDAEVIDAITQFARTYLLSTALPPIIPKATLTALEIIVAEKWRRQKLSENISHFNMEAKKRSINVISDDITPIRCLLVKDACRVLKIKNYLSQHGVLVSAIRPPTVPKNGSRIRVSLSAFHDKQQISLLLDLIGEQCEGA